MYLQIDLSTYQTDLPINRSIYKSTCLAIYRNEAKNIRIVFQSEFGPEGVEGPLRLRGAQTTVG